MDIYEQSETVVLIGTNWDRYTYFCNVVWIHLNGLMKMILGSIVDICTLFLIFVH